MIVTKNILALLLVLSLGYTSGNVIKGTGVMCTELQEAESPWMVDCNRCECNGGLETCSDNTCLPNTECDEGSPWMIDCNRCHCIDGLGSCSDNTCAPNTECGVEGATWKDGCKFCYCFNGRASCSDKTCLPNIERSTLIELSDSNIVDHGGFKPGGSGPESLLTEEGTWNPNPKPWFVTFDFKETHTVDNVTIINTGDSVHDVTGFMIESSNDNQEWTLVDVITKVAPGDDQPQFFSISGEGQYWKLTIQNTASQYQPWVDFFGFFGYEGTYEKSECVEGTSWTDNCNICTCQSGYAACTLRTCLAECIEGSYVVDDCNTCLCYDGQVDRKTCTTKKCLSDPVPKCKEGSRWTEKTPEKCSTTCICSNDVITCTEEICPPKEAEGDAFSTQLPDACDNATDPVAYKILGCSVMVGARREMESCGNKVNEKDPLFYKKCLNCEDKGCQAGCQACDDCANISKCHVFNAKTCKCHKKFRCKV